MKVSKENAAAWLRNIGYKAEVENGAVIAYLDMDDFLSAKAKRTIGQTLCSIGYTGSWGIKPK